MQTSFLKQINTRELAMRIAQGFVFWVILGSCLAATGCQNLGSYRALPPDVPRENNKMLIGEYVINPPDVLVIDLIRAVPLPPYKIKPLDLLYINVRGTPAEDPIKGVFRVEPDGIVRLGPAYGSLPVLDLTIDDAIRDITKHLKTAGNLKDPQVSLTLEETRGVQLIKGEHLVRPDGNINLGFYGTVSVGGLTQDKAKAAIEEHLSKHFLKPKISIDIGGFNSSVYYVIFDGGGAGEQVVRLSHTGSETVLDAIGLVAGLPAVASKSRVWLARPTKDSCEDQVLHIDWRAITQRGRTATNYQVYPGDRIYVGAEPLVTADTALGRALAPVERIFGITLLGTSTVSGFRSSRLNGNNNSNNP
jgi:polysaccharide biosynthesis/export protein